MRSRLTPWFDGWIPPIRVGVYMRRYSRGKNLEMTLFCFWDGQHWFMGAITPAEAVFKTQHGPAMQQSLPWRGLAEEP